MGVLTRLLALDDQTPLPGPLDDYWYRPIGLTSAAGVRVTADSAMAQSAVFACVRVIAESMASLPLLTYERLPDGGKRRAPEHPLYGLLATRPNKWQTSFEWREMLFGHALLRGNAYNHIMPGPRGFADQLIPIHPDRVTTERASDGTLIYDVLQPDNITKVPFLQDEIFHLRGFSSDGITGISIVALMKESIGLAQAAESYGARVFSQDASPKGVLKFPGRLSPEALARLRATWQERHAGLNNAHSTAVLEEGMTWEQIGMSNEDAEFLNTRRFQLEEIARYFRMQHHKIGIMERSTYSNIEHQAIEHVTDTLRPWAVRFEQAAARDLIFVPGKYFVEFLFDALLRGDTLSRFQAYQYGINSGWLNRNEVREMENRVAVPGLDKFMEPMNMAPAGQAPAAKGQPPVDPTVQQSLHLARLEAGRIVRKEIAAVRKAAPRFAADDDGWKDWLAQFYGELAASIAADGCVTLERAQAYIARQQKDLLAAGVSILETWEPTRSEELAMLMLQGGANGE